MADEPTINLQLNLDYVQDLRCETLMVGGVPPVKVNGGSLQLGLNSGEPPAHDAAAANYWLALYDGNGVYLGKVRVSQ
jgi:hypothetical protein